MNSITSVAILSLGWCRPRARPLGAASRLLPVLLSAGLALGCSGGRSPILDVGPGDGSTPDLLWDVRADAPAHPDGRSDLDSVPVDLLADAPDLSDAVPHEVDAVDSAAGPDVELDAPGPEVGDAAETVDLEIAPDVPFWEEYWDNDVPWDPGVCQSVDEGYLPGGVPAKSCDFSGVSGDMMGQHGVFLEQAQSFAKEPCQVPQCLEGALKDAILLRVYWKDKAAELTYGAFCDWTQMCPWLQEAACEKHKFPPKVKVFVLDLQGRTIHFVRNELAVSEFSMQCQGCTKFLNLTVLEDEVCAAPVIVEGLHPATPWGDSIDYLCWKEPLSDGTEANVCVMAALYIGFSVSYDILSDELMNYDYTALTCFALVDGECIDLPLGLP